MPNGFNLIEKFEVMVYDSHVERRIHGEGGLKDLHPSP